MGEIWCGLRPEGINYRDCWRRNSSHSFYILIWFHHVEGFTLGAGEGVDEVAEGASGMCVVRIGEIGDRASEGQAARMYKTGFTAESLVGMRRGSLGSRLVLTRS